MKLSTMRLPTGEFILVASKARYSDTIPQAMADLKDAVGAAGFFATDDDVEVEDATVDEDVRRVDGGTPYQKAVEQGGDSFTSFYFPNLGIDHVGTLQHDGTVTFSATAHPAEDPSLSPADIAVTRAIMEGQEFSPAGLVIGPHKNTGTPPADEQGTPGADPVPDGGVAPDIDEPLGQAVEDDEDSYDEPIGQAVDRPFLAGDRVIVNGTSWLNTRVVDFVGRVEEVPERHRRRVEESTHRDGYTVRVREEDGAGRTMYFRPEAVKHYDMVED